MSAPPVVPAARPANPALALAIPFASGVLFTLGLALAGMTRPAKVFAFLDLTGDWDPSLAFVMIGAIGLHSLAYLAVRRMERPLADERFHVPKSRTIDRRLLAGAALFGAGWGIGGFCPGPALASIPSGHWQVLLFVVAMTVGMGIFEVVGRAR